MSPGRNTIRLHLTNVAGTGASQLLQSLLPALEAQAGIKIEHIYLPDRGALAGYRASGTSVPASVYRRYLPNALSRLLECTLLAHRFDGNSPLLVFGDLPLSCRGPQTVFVQTPHLIGPPSFGSGMGFLRGLIFRAVFRLNQQRVRAFIVQTDLMRQELERTYPQVTGRVYVLGQPAPSWLLGSGLRRRGYSARTDGLLRLFYPAAGYPHKNHRLLAEIAPHADWPVEKLVLTLAQAENPAPRLAWVRCAGSLSAQEMLDAYSRADALLFLSKAESYGFPLVEAMLVGLPIVCPDLPYARTLCGEQALYFEPDSPDSLRAALEQLREHLLQGWWPDWSAQLRSIPSNWDSVAQRMLEIAGGTDRIA